MRKTMVRQVGQPPMKQQANIVLVLFANFDESVPYRVGSKWSIEVKPSGALALHEVKA